MEHVYLDSAATTRLRPQVLEAMQPYLEDRFGNANSLHSPGRAAREALDDSRAKLAKRLGCLPDEVIFTSGGTESNNLALKGAALANAGRGRHIITTAIEHSSILGPCKWLQANGFEVTYLKVDGFGRVSASQVSEAIRKDTVLVSVGHANNEIGTIQDIAGIAKVAEELGAIFHTDACQSFTKVPVDVKSMGLGLVTVNAHKIHGPKGTGALVLRRGTRIEPVLHGGQQERGLRGGTENVPGIVGFAAAAGLATDGEAERMKGLRDRLIGGVRGGIGGVRLNGHPTERLPNNANFTFSGVEGESLLLRLDLKGVYCSTGSACSSQSLEPSHVITAIGLPPEEAHGSIRMTVGYDNTDGEIDYALSALKDEVESLRRISPLGRR
jgi:cysteine desulfurase